MARIAAVGVNDDLAAGQTAVALGPADFKVAGRVDMQRYPGLDQILWQDGVDDVLGHRDANFLMRDAGFVLGGNDHGIDAVGLAIDVAHGDL